MLILARRGPGPTRSAATRNRSIGSRRAQAGRRTERGHWTMEIVIAAAVLAAGLVVAALLLVRRAPGLATAGNASHTTSRPKSGPKQPTVVAEPVDDASM